MRTEEIKGWNSHKYRYVYQTEKRVRRMGRKVNVLGTELDNLTVCEMLKLAKELLNREALSIMAEVSTGMLLLAGEDLEYREKLEALDLGIIGEKEVLEAAGIHETERYAEVEEGRFLTGFLKYVAENGKRAVLFCETRQESGALARYLSDAFPGLSVVGQFSQEDAAEDEDDIVNRMNGASADVILASMESPEQENFAFCNRGRLNVKVWLGVGKSPAFSGIPELKPRFWERLIEKRIFKKKITKFQQDKQENYEK